jgi:hypothetical protein
VTGTWTDPALSGVTFGVIAERWLSTKATRAPKTVAGYRSLLDTVVLPRWKDVPLREVQFDNLQVWITGLSVNGSVRFEGNGLSASRVRQTHQLVGAVLRFAVKAKHLPASPADGIELPRLPEVEQRYLTHEQLHGPRWPQGGCGPWSWFWATAVCGSVRRLPYGSPMWMYPPGGYGCADPSPMFARPGWLRAQQRTTPLARYRYRPLSPGCWQPRSATMTKLRWYSHLLVVVT